MDVASFPCATTLADGGAVVRTSYLHAGDGFARVYAWSRATRQVYVAVEAVQVEQADRGRWRLLDADGTVVAQVEHTPRDCACNHPMKHWKPSGATRQSVTG